MTISRSKWQALRVRPFTRLGLALGFSYWILESLLDVFVWNYPSMLVALLAPPGHELWMRLTVTVLFVVFGFYGDHLLSKRHGAEERALLANAELNQIFDTAADGMRVVDRDFNILRANETFVRMTGLGREELLGRKCYEVFRGHRCHTPECPLREIVEGAERVEYDSEKRTLDGRVVPSIVTATPFRRPDGTVVGIVEDFKDISERKRAEKEIRESRERLRELTSHLQLIREEERGRIEREIHDELGQALAALNMDVYWIRKRLPKEAVALREKTEDMSRLIGRTVDSVRRICLELRPWLLDDFGLSAAVEWLTGEFAERTGLPCRTSITPREILLDQDVSIAVYRILQEALTNIIRHAEASRVEVELDYTSPLLRLRVADDGKGMDQAGKKKGSFGLIGIRERAHGFGGDVVIRSSGKGTSLEVRIPVGAGRRDEPLLSTPSAQPGAA